MTKRRQDPSKGNPRTGNGRAAKGKKPTETGIMQMRSTPDGMNPDGGLRRKQPKGWGIARVVDIFTGKPKEK